MTNLPNWIRCCAWLCPVALAYAFANTANAQTEAIAPNTAASADATGVSKVTADSASPNDKNDKNDKYDYRSPMRPACTKEIEQDVDWFFALKERFIDLYYFGVPDSIEAAHDQKTIPPNFKEGYVSPMRIECEAELARDAAWRAGLQSYFGSLLSYEFHTRNSGAFTTNQRHVIMAYAGILVILVLTLIGLLLRQRRFAEDIERLRADIARAAAD